MTRCLQEAWKYAGILFGLLGEGGLHFRRERERGVVPFYTWLSCFTQSHSFGRQWDFNALLSINGT